MIATPSIYISDIIEEVAKETEKTYEDVERALFEQHLYPAGEPTYFDASDNPSNWLEEGLCAALKKENLTYVQFHE